jgi:signal transduction histidine kinase/DNA-binding response OmpR family regulator/HAMP domain-containing protein
MITLPATGQAAETTTDLVTVLRAVRNGDLQIRAVPAGSPAEVRLAAALNEVLDHWSRKLQEAEAAADPAPDLCRLSSALRRGRPASALPLEAGGKPLRGRVLRLTSNLNGVLEQIGPLASEVSRLVREMESEGKLGGEIQVRGATGLWKDLARGVNRLARHLTAQVRAIAEVATAVADGDLTRSIPVEARGEMGAVRDSINKMIRNLRETTRKNAEQDWLKTNLAAFTRTLQGQRDIETISRQILSELAPLVHAQQGAFYLAEERAGQEAVLHFLAGYACESGRDLPAQVRAGEGLMGECARQRKTILVSRVPAGFLRIRSGLGEARACSVVVLPVLFENHLKAVIELASFAEFQPVHVAFLEEVTESIGIVCNTIAATMRTEALLAQSQALTQELQKTNAELEEKAEQLALTSRYKSEFMANMSHELRTPLNSLLILARLLAENVEQTLTPKQVEYAGAILASGTDLLSLINDILDLSKIESGTMNTEVRSVRLREVCNDLEPLFRPIAQSKRLAFSIEVDPSMPSTMITDSKRLQQILRNLLSNAFKFTSQGSVSLRIGVASSGWRRDHAYLGRAGPVLYFAVDDTGIGIPADKQSVIFEPFQQADMTTSRKYGGTGLGLSISRELAKLLAGEIRLVSSVGQGSTFTLFVPRVHPTFSFTGILDESAEAPADSESSPLFPVEAEVKEPADSPAAAPPGKNLMLLVEYDGERESDVLEVAREHGIDGIVAAGTEPALDLARRVRPAAIVAAMGDCAADAWHLLDRLKHDPELCHIPVWMIAPKQHARRAREAGAWDSSEAPPRRDVLEETFSRLKRLALEPQRSLLVIDDDPARSRGVADLLSGEHLGIALAATGAEGIEALRRDSFDVVVLGSGLPDLGGSEFLLAVARLCGDSGRPPVILSSGSPGLAPPLRAAAGDAVLLKEARSPEQLLKEAVLRLHRPLGSLSEPQRRLFEKARTPDPLLAGRRVLVADDDLRNIYALTTIFERHAMDVRYALNGKEALLALRKTPDIEIVLMDIMMPEMDGFEAMRAIRKVEQHRSLPIIALTAKAMPEDRQKCIEAGATDYTPKPVDIERLLSQIRVWLYQP